METTTYEGSCHCGRVRFEVDLELDYVRLCDCSVCRKRGALIHRVETDRLRMLSPVENLTLYQWHTRTAKDYFCSTCGILPFRRPRALTPEEIKQNFPKFSGWSINVRCLKGLDLNRLSIKHIYGSKLE